jgi:hypothetical protein
MEEHRDAALIIFRRQDLSSVVFAVVHEVDHCRDCEFAVVGQVDCIRVRLLHPSQRVLLACLSCVAHSEVTITGFGEEV